MQLSVVIPVQNEVSHLGELVSRLLGTLNATALTYELLFVTDCNYDGTYEKLLQLEKQIESLHVIKLTRSFGQYAALRAGLSRSHGAAVVIMDGDLQDHPEDIIKLYDKFVEGFEIVYVKKDKKNDLALRDLATKFYLFILNRFSSAHLNFNTNLFRIMSSRVVEQLLATHEREFNITFLSSYLGHRTSYINGKYGKRASGTSKYSLGQLFSLAWNGILGHTNLPVIFLFFISTFSFCFGLGVFLAGILRSNSLSLPVSLICLILSVLFLGMGILASYLHRTLQMQSGLPHYVVESETRKSAHRQLSPSEQQGSEVMHNVEDRLQ